MSDEVEEKKKPRGFQKGNTFHRKKGVPNKDPDAIWKSKRKIVWVTANMQDVRKLEWVMKYFQLRGQGAGYKMALNMLYEIMLGHQKGFEIYMERKFAKKIYRRRIIIS